MRWVVAGLRLAAGYYRGMNTEFTDAQVQAHIDGQEAPAEQAGEIDNVEKLIGLLKSMRYECNLRIEKATDDFFAALRKRASR